MNSTHEDLQNSFELSLLQRIWRFERGDGSIVSPRIGLKRDGTIVGHKHNNETSWGLSNGVLVFRDLMNEETTRFDSVIINTEGKMTLKGQFLNTQVSHVLTEIRRTTGTGPMNVNPRVAVLVRTHLVNEKLYDLLDTLTRSRRFDLFVSTDETNGPLNVVGFVNLPHTIHMCQKFGLSVEHNRLLWKCGDYALYFAAFEIPDYDYYVMIEYDVDFVRKSPVFLEALISRFHNPDSSKFDFISVQFDVAHPDWGWRKNASLMFPKIFNTGIFAFVAVSKGALEYLYRLRCAEAARCRSFDELTHCEAFCGSALAAAEDYNCTSINVLLENSVEFKSFHPPVFHIENSHYLLDHYRIDDPRIEMVHPVFDLEMYLQKEYEKSLERNDLLAYLDELETIGVDKGTKHDLISKFKERALATIKS